MPDWVLAAERAYVAAAVAGRANPAADEAGASSAPVPRATSADAIAAAERPGHATATEHPAYAIAAAEQPAYAIAAAGAVASHYLAVAAPRSFGLVIDDVAQVEAAALSLVAHRTWFAPRDIRCAAVAGGAAELAAATQGRAVSVDEALACDIACVHAARLSHHPTAAASRHARQRRH